LSSGALKPRLSPVQRDTVVISRFDGFLYFEELFETVLELSAVPATGLKCRC
jgi:hypothetical protein